MKPSKAEEFGLRPYCKSYSSFKAQFAILSLYKSTFSPWFQQILLSLEYVQLLSLTMFIHPSVSHISNPNDSRDPLLFEIVAYSLKLANPSYLLSFENSNSTTTSVLASIFAFTLFKYAMLSWAIYTSLFNKDPNSLLKSIWRYFFTLQGRVICCFITSFWVKTIQEISYGSFYISWMSNGAIISISVILVILEYLLSFLFETQLCSFVPTKSYLSSKNLDMQIITLTQKLVIQIIQLCVYSNTTGSIWVLVILNLIISLMREYTLFKTLPLYNYKALQHQGDFLAIVLSFHLAHFLQHILISSDYEKTIDFRFLIILWILFAVMASFISRTLLKQIHVQLLTKYSDDQHQCVERLLHKIFATKHLIRTRRIRTQSTQQFEIKYFLGVVQTLHFKQIFNVKSQEPISEDILDQKEINEIFLAFLEGLALRFPKNSLVKLNLAYRNYKSERFHAEIIHVLSDLQKSIWSIDYTSSVLLLHDIKTTAITRLDQEFESKNHLNIIKYMETQSLMEDLTDEILKQIELKKEICNNIIQNTCDLEIIYQNAQILHKSRIKTQNKVNKLLNYMPEYYTTPFLILAEYSLSLNYSPGDFHKYYESYLRRSSKFASSFDVNDLCEQNLYQDTNAFLVISLETGCIAYSTESLQTICGPDRNRYTGTHITRLFPHGIRNQYNEIFTEIREKGQSNFTNKVSNSYLIHKEGYLVEADLFIQVHPYISQNLYIDMIIRPRNSYQDFILMNKTGKIEGATRDISRSLRIEKSLFNSSYGPSIHIKQISEELSQLNNAFNVLNKSNHSALNAKFRSLFHPSERFRMLVNFVQKSLGENQAQQLYDLYNSGAKPIQLMGLAFKCKISSLDLKTSSFNLLTLQKSSMKHNGLESVNSKILAIHKKRDSDRPQLKEIKSPLHAGIPGKDILTPRIHSNQFLETEDNLLAPPTSSRFFLKSNPPQALAELRAINEDIRDGLNSSLDGGEGSQMTTKSAQMITLFKSFERAINTKSYQDSFSFLCLIFYGVIILTLACQIVLKSVLDHTMNNLIIKTDLLNSAQLRTFHYTLISNSARGSALQFAGTLAVGDAGIPDEELKAGLYIMLASQVVLKQSNDIIINNIASESNEIKQMLFEQDIAVLGNMADPSAPGIQYVNSFQHADILNDVTRLLDHLHPFVSMAGYNAFTFVIANSANDCLAKNQEITDAFVSSVNQQKEQLQTMINLIVIILPLLSAGIVLLLSVIVWKQYVKEKRHLLAFLKLNPSMISHILNNLNSMQKRLRFQEKSDEEEVPRLIYQFHDFAQYTSYHKTQDLKSVRYEKMQKRYFGYIFKTLFYISLLITIVILNYVFISRATNKIYRQQKQLQYANDISTISMISYTAESATFMSNNTDYIMRKLSLDVWTEGIKQIGEFQENIYSVFQDEDGEYDPDVRAVLFEEAVCDELIPAAVPFCVSLKALAEPTSMFSTLALYQKNMVSKLADFHAADKSSILGLIGVAIVGLSYILGAAVATSGQAQLINQIISRNLTVSVNDLYHLATIILIIFSITLVIVSVLIWFQILRKIKEVNNDFKKVLAVLPPNIILSSFLLKSFLNRTSNIAQK